ncbi:MAG: hypothetical protein U5Q03_12710 [Bacteroidota bacterium]|nr:hypothetical protein [Bacteroidota bacterium]
MRKLTIIFSITMLFVFTGINKTFSQTDYWVNNIYWNDANCSCTDPVQIDITIVVYDLITQQIVDNNAVYNISSTQPYTYAGNANIRTNCDEDCYRIYVYMTYKDNGGTCCSGNDSETVTGQELVGGSWPFSQTVVLN